MSLLKISGKVSTVLKRDIGILAPVMQKASDPIQQLFLDKIKEFKSKTGGGKLTGLSPEIEKEINSDKERLYRQYGCKPGEDLSKLPSMDFTEPALEEPSYVKLLKN